MLILVDYLFSYSLLYELMRNPTIYKI